MDIQSIAVILIVASAFIYLGRKYYRAAKSAGGGGGCGCGCGDGCPAEKRSCCGGEK